MKTQKAYKMKLKITIETTTFKFVSDKKKKSEKTRKKTREIRREDKNGIFNYSKLLIHIFHGKFLVANKLGKNKSCRLN